MIINICRIIIPLLIIVQISLAQNGIVKSYFPDGTVQSEVSYVNDVLDGAAISYYSNGKIWAEKNYSQGILDGFVREYYESGLLKEEYFVQKGIKEGACRKYSVGGELVELLSYSSGQLINKQKFKSESVTAISGNILTALPAPHQTSSATEKNNLTAVSDQQVSGKENMELKADEAIATNNEDEIICDAQECPVPIGGIRAVLDSLVYPEHALRYGLEGIVKIIATVSTDGIVTKTQILKGIGLGCDEAAQEAIRKTKFIPGRTNGLPVESNATITVEFKIPGK
ncbi:MAG: hypothetical protein CVV24_04765 [Ignavibacteriae bacterium HGW-Ignavibacteriae-3]|nr:MAG: hypothetical protein CVV24_04765 [Ignavibacteriae bacterium HGW-Ignavibacteriae-3]